MNFKEFAKEKKKLCGKLRKSLRKEASKSSAIIKTLENHEKKKNKLAAAAEELETNSAIILKIET